MQKPDSIFSVLAQNRRKRLGPFLFARTGRTQAATWAWAGKVPRALAPSWADELAQRNSTVRSDPKAERPFRADQKRRRDRRPRNPSHSTLPFLSLLRRSLSSLFSRSSEPQPRAKERRASGPLRCRRPPRRCACSPTGEHAAIERPGRGASLAEPGESAPPARLLLPRWRKGSSDAP